LSHDRVHILASLKDSIFSSELQANMYVKLLCYLPKLINLCHICFLLYWAKSSDTPVFIKTL